MFDLATIYILVKKIHNEKHYACMVVALGILHVPPIIQTEYYMKVRHIIPYYPAYQRKLLWFVTIEEHIKYLKWVQSGY